MGSFSVIFPAAGQSSRFGDSRDKKIYHDLDGRAVWLRAVEPFINRQDVCQTILAIAPEDREMFERRYRASVVFMDIQVIEGGAERHDTVARALEILDPACQFVAVHDAARPCINRNLIDAVFAAAQEHGAAVPAIPVADTLRRFSPEKASCSETVSRLNLHAVQTPQAFRRDWLEAAYARRDRIKGPITDDAQLVEALGKTCHLVTGSRFNLKITTREDLKIAHAMLNFLNEPQKAASLHPFADEIPNWNDDTPPPSNLFK